VVHRLRLCAIMASAEILAKEAPSGQQETPEFVNQGDLVMEQLKAATMADCSPSSAMGVSTMVAAALVTVVTAGLAAGVYRVNYHRLYQQVFSLHGLVTSVLGITTLGLGLHYTTMGDHIEAAVNPVQKHPFVFSSAAITGLLGYGSSFVVQKYLSPETNIPVVPAISNIPPISLHCSSPAALPCYSQTPVGDRNPSVTDKNKDSVTIK